jgi:hypothetical protein
MAVYFVLAFHPSANGGYDVTIGGPGIPIEGIGYWFGRKDEVNCFVDNLNILYSDAKQLATWRRARAGKRMSRALQTPHLAAR